MGREADTKSTVNKKLKSKIPLTIRGMNKVRRKINMKIN